MQNTLLYGLCAYLYLLTLHNNVQSFICKMEELVALCYGIL